MMIEFKYSVLMSIYENDDLEGVRRSISSIRNQTLKSDDVVVVFDGQVNPRVDEFVTSQCQDWRIIRLAENVGLGGALKVGLPECKNLWVMRMDADDTCPAIRSTRLLEGLSKQNNEKIAAIGSYISENNTTTKENALIKYPAEFAVRGKVNYFRDPIGHASAMINRELVAEVGGYRKCLYFEDTYLWLRLLTRGYTLASVPEILYEARVDAKFYSRRSGVRYGIIELQNFFKFYFEGLITLRSLLLNVIVRPFIRMFPKPLLKKFYLVLLRAKN